MKIWNKCICLTSPKSLMILGTLLISTLVIASVWSSENPVIIEQPPIEITEVEEIDSTELWIPTKEDIAYQDSMFTIIQNTQDDVTEIKQDIVLIIERLDYEDGTSDSIKYVKNGPIDKRRN